MKKNKVKDIGQLRLETLNISRTPWERESTSAYTPDMDCVFNACTWNARSIPDATMATAAPNLYAALYDALLYFCARNCPYSVGSVACRKCRCRAHEWLFALEDASGKEVRP